MWKELTMVMGTDAMLGTDAETPEEAAGLLRTLTEHLTLFTATFAFDASRGSGTVLTHVPASFRKQLDSVLKGYLALQEALAGDDFEGAWAVAGQTAVSLKSVDMNLLEGAAHTAWMKALETIGPGLSATSEAQDISAARLGFGPLSQGLIEAVSTLGVTRNGPLFELFCSMAFDDKGASWLQADDDIRNPYYGAAMLKCGEVRRQVKVR